MKGITHFAVGVAAASCFPEAVRAGADGNPLYFLLGGAFGLLPDTLDFKFYKFFYRREMEVVPDPNAPDAAMIAQAIAYAVDRARRTRRRVRIKLNTIRLGADKWQQYTVRLEVPEQRVVVSFGPQVNTGRTPISRVPVENGEASAPLACPVRLEYQATTTVDILDGPMFEMKPAPDGKVAAGFIPWHREWSHSLPVALAFSLAGFALWGTVAALVVFAAYAAHILVDQLGFMGSNLFFPFTRERTGGWQKFRSDNSAANFAFVWCALLLIFWNLYRATPRVPWSVNPAQVAVFGAIVPLVLLLATRRLLANKPTAAAAKRAKAGKRRHTAEA